jgi:hypothetical protein
LRDTMTPTTTVQTRFAEEVCEGLQKPWTEGIAVEVSL